MDLENIPQSARTSQVTCFGSDEATFVEGRTQSRSSQTRTRGFGELQDLDRDIRRRAFLARFNPIGLTHVVKKRAKSGLKKAKGVLRRLAGLGGRV